MAVNEAPTASLHTAAARSRSRGQGAHVRGHGWPSSRRRVIGEHQGQSNRPDVGATGMPGAMAFRPRSAWPWTAMPTVSQKGSLAQRAKPVSPGCARKNQGVVAKQIRRSDPSPGLKATLSRRERAKLNSAARQSPICFCRCSRRSCASSESVAMGRASRRSRPISSSVSSQYP